MLLTVSRYEVEVGFLGDEGRLESLDLADDEFTEVLHDGDRLGYGDDVRPIILILVDAD